MKAALPFPARGWLIAIAICVFHTFAFGCADLFGTPTQCTSDSDCARFNGVCDLSQNVCVDETPLPDASTASNDASQATPVNDATFGDVDVPNKCDVSPKATKTIGTQVDAGRSEITGSVTLGCDTDWALESLVFVRAGATLTIEAGTTIHAKKGVKAGIIVSTGGTILANGQRDLPIVMTSNAATPSPGDWRGVFVLGLASPADQTPFNNDADLPWGGAKDDDNSGVLNFVRIEYSESGLTLSGVGNKTKVDFVEVRKTTDNCFFFNGGDADVKHLVCQFSGDDQFEWGTAAKGRAQFLFGQHPAPPPVDGSHGLLVDNSNPKIFNVTMCGDSPPPLGYGLLFRDGATLDLNNAILTNFFTGLDATGSIPTPGNIRSSIVANNATNPAYVEDDEDPADQGANNFDDDNGFDEIAFFNDPAQKNSTVDPKLVACLNPTAPKPWAPASLTTNAASPPTDGFFDVNATYIGAFKDANDSWMTGAWLRFDNK